MRLSTTYKLILLSTLCVVVSGCSHTFDENNNYVSKDVLHKMPMELMPVDRTDLADRGVSISVADNRPFTDTGSASEDSSEYFIDLNQDDTKESREKTIGYILTTFTGLSNIVIPHKITDVFTNYIQKTVKHNNIENKTISVKIEELWESCFGNAAAISNVASIVLKRGLNAVDKVGYRYKFVVDIIDNDSGFNSTYICKNADYQDILALNEEDITNIYQNMMKDIELCINDNIR